MDVMDVRFELQRLVRAAARDALRLGAQPEQCCPLRDYVRDVLFAPARGGHANPRTAEHELAMDATSLNSALHDAGGGRVPLAAIARATTELEVVYGARDDALRKVSALALEDYLLYHMDYRVRRPPTVGERRYPNQMPRVAQACRDALVARRVAFADLAERDGADGACVADGRLRAFVLREAGYDLTRDELDELLRAMMGRAAGAPPEGGGGGGAPRVSAAAFAAFVDDALSQPLRLSPRKQRVTGESVPRAPPGSAPAAERVVRFAWAPGLGARNAPTAADALRRFSKFGPVESLQLHAEGGGFAGGGFATYADPAAARAAAACRKEHWPAHWDVDVEADWPRVAARARPGATRW